MEPVLRMTVIVAGAALCGYVLYLQGGAPALAVFVLGVASMLLHVLRTYIRWRDSS